MERGFNIEKILQSIIILPSAEARQAAYELMMTRYMGLLALEPAICDVIENRSIIIRELSSEELAMAAGGKSEENNKDMLAQKESVDIERDKTKEEA